MTEPSPSEFVHPETGEVLETREEFQAALAELDARLTPVYRLMRPIREEYAERFEVVLPPVRSRTQIQEKVARCPRCGSRYVTDSEEDEDGG